jgi:hypothetical protein
MKNSSSYDAKWAGIRSVLIRNERCVLEVGTDQTQVGWRFCGEKVEVCHGRRFCPTCDVGSLLDGESSPD